jgi:hypothetical protein
MTKKAEKYVSMCNIPVTDEAMYGYIKKALIRSFDAGYRKAKKEVTHVNETRRLGPC